jgi:hypothetical protein
VDGTAERVV